MTTRDEWRGRTGHEWARRDDALERLLGPAGHEGVAELAASPGERVLDLGCGSGASTAELAMGVGETGHVTAIDISPDLLSLARERLAAAPQVTCLEADIARHGFQTEHYDAVYSRFGTMFFDDPVAALRNVHGALKPEGRTVFVAWRDAGRNQWASVPMTFTADGATSGGPSPRPGPFGWAERDVFEPILTAAGFRSIRPETFEYMAEISDGDDPDPVQRAVAFMMRIGPLAARLRGASEDAKRETSAFLAQRLTRHVTNGAVRLRACAWIIRATA
ncbi:MAG: class I SAM-dependent methyltransferase [Pseudomonadota bacterium]